MSINMDVLDLYAHGLPEPSAPPFDWAPKTEWTAVKIERTVLDVIESLSLLGVLTVGALAAASIVTLPAALCIGIPVALLGGGLLAYRSTLIDYENGIELMQSRFKAMDMTLSQVVKKHGWEKLLKYELLSPEAMRTKFYAEASGVTAAEFLARYDLRYLQKSGCVNAQQFQILKNIKREYDSGLNAYHVEKSRIESRYHQNVSLAREMRDLQMNNVAPNDVQIRTAQLDREYNLRVSILELEKERDLSPITARFEEHLLGLNARFLRVIQH
jgi:hypothetical protein